MTTEEHKVTKCDAEGCEKEISRYPEKPHGYIRSPSDPWLTVSIGGHWVTDYGKYVGTDFDACSPECAIKILEKTIEKLKSTPVLNAMRVL